MTNNINSINSLSANNNILPTVEVKNIEKHLNKSKNSKLLVLNLDDLNVDILNQLKEKQCRMVLLNQNFKIVEERKANSIQQIHITIDGYKQSVAIENIVRFEAYGNYTYIHLKNRTKPVLTSRTLKYYVGLISEENFIRPHHKHLINLLYVNGLNKAKLIELKDGTTIIVSRRRMSYVKKILQSGG